MNNLNWDDLKFFLALHETNTVSKAAERLNVNYATVSRRIDRLEDALKLKLFDRTQDGFLSTIEGHVLYEKALEMREKVDALGADLSPETLFNQNTKISMVPFLAEHVVIENLAPLHHRFPELRFEIETSTRNVNISKLEADIALRLELPEKGESICKKLGDITYVLYGNDYWIDRLEKNENVNVITYSTAFSHLPECQYLIERFGIKSIKLQTDSISAQKKASEAGFGVALIPKIAVDPNLNVYREPAKKISREVWMLTSKKTAHSTAKKLVMDELIKIFQHTLSL
ncbi:LysR family transcriptional regulator [Marinomonas mediterranea]|jgi:Transcriptional regulator|uniref:Transcriptional regulator, LysR family n=1 Tax=Marinomonas mediterranea (strain ATCC 700492 / JCM 21426 / NBRC 103028 / MMB-1) TaxID=717774 RepID=F2JVF8_MARM1|nr:LysR family transcriptional regulator [Marinomonas mediterranea]ADZ89416.1 transcriptional regulator, LysR family [Marinomonas mediterranea MMB-1]WCN07510.1 LysR family transcriptional regulator [Marinomonas mediterranea]WCN15674.1 LysR family transcriptional regulator [Marinomonas mediterranea MMB-1]